MRNAVVRSQLHHLGVHHDEAHVLRRGLVEEADDQRVGAHGLAGARGARDEHVGQRADIPDDVPPADVTAQGKGHLGLMPGEIPGLDDVPDEHRGHLLVGHLNAHHGNFVGNGGDAHAGGPQGQGDVVRQVGDFGELDPLFQDKLVPGDGGTVDHIAGGGVHAEAGQGFRQTAGVVSKLRPGLHMVLLLVHPQQVHRGIQISAVFGGQFFFNLRGHGGGLGRHLLGRLGLAAAGEGFRRGEGFLRLNRSGFHLRGDGFRTNGFCCGFQGFRYCRGSGGGNGFRYRCGGRHGNGRTGPFRFWFRNGLRFRRRGRLGLEHLVRRGLGVGLVAEETGEFPGLFRLGGTFLTIQGDVDLGFGTGRSPALGRVCRGDPDGGLGLLLILRTRPLPVGKRRQGQPQGHEEQGHEQHRE